MQEIKELCIECKAEIGDGKALEGSNEIKQLISNISQEMYSIDNSINSLNGGKSNKSIFYCEEADELMRKILIVMDAIREKYPVSDKLVEDSMPCPLCESGRLYFRLNDHSNGHVSAICTTNNCIQFME